MFGQLACAIRRIKTQSFCSVFRCKSVSSAPKFFTSPTRCGGVVERSNTTVLKTVRPERVSWVRIPPPPPVSPALALCSQFRSRRRDIRPESTNARSVLLLSFESLQAQHLFQQLTHSLHYFTRSTVVTFAGTQKRARSHAASVLPSTEATHQVSAPRKAQTVSLVQDARSC
jgi:hypothetical protein